MAEWNRRKKARRGLRWWEWIQAFFGVIIMLVLAGTTAGVLFAAHLISDTAQSLESVETVVEYQPGGVTEVYATDKDPKTGKNILLGKVYGRFREYKPINEIPDFVKFATVAIEDERFYEHSGVDLHGIARALYQNYRSGRMEQGASTLTQQLARNLVLKNNKKTIDRKIQEALLSIQLERSFSKEEILEMYLNEVCYGANTFGIQAASKMYFNKPVEKLTLSEAALLVGLPQRPSHYEPFHHYDHDKKKWTDDVVLDRRDTVLAKMQEVRDLDLAREEPRILPNLPKIKDLDLKDFDTAKKAKLTLAPKPDPQNTNFKAPYFTNYVLRQLVQKYGSEKVYNGGLRVYTTLNYKMQQEAERALINGVIKANERGVTEGALVSLEPRTGYVRALVGGTNYKKNKFDNAIQGRRQPGSTFKAFVYATAFASGKYTPNSYVSDSYVRYGNWAPKNYGGGYHGTVSLRQAFTFSYNIPAVKIANEVGIKNVLQTANKMGIDTRVMEQQNNLALALGAGEVSPLELASAYATFPNRGSHAHPMFIIRVIDAEGNELPGFEPKVDKQVLPESVVAQVSELMSAVVDHGTASNANGIKEVPGARGKTGTTNDNRDAWFVGYTPELSTAVWVCGVRRYLQGKKVVVKYPPMSGITGGAVCAPIWARYMKAAVPIQQQYEKSLKKLPEQVIPKTKDLIPPPAPTPEPSPTPASLDIPRENTPEPAEQPEKTEKPETILGDDVPVEAADTAAVTKPEPPRKEPRGVAEPNLRPASRTTEIEPPRPRVTRNIDLREPKASLPRAAKHDVTVMICPESGARASKWCPVAVGRSYPEGKAPKSVCQNHRPMPGDG
ncbi:MAG: penicillin-binding protein 1A [Armatimonadaceae bacterium]